MTSLRQAVVDEARTWVGTPFVHHQCAKGVGVDCCTILSAVYERFTGQKINLPHYDVQWNSHRDDEPYLVEILRHCVEVSPWPGEEFVPSGYSIPSKREKDMGVHRRGFDLDVWDRKPPLPGDIAMWWFGKAWAHTTIVLEWPVVLNPMNLGSCRVTPEFARTVGSISEGGRCMRMRLMRPKIFIVK